MIFPSAIDIAPVLQALGVSYLSYEHPPLANCDVAKSIGLQREGVALKNLFFEGQLWKAPLSCYYVG